MNDSQMNYKTLLFLLAEKKNMDKQKKFLNLSNIDSMVD